MIATYLGRDDEDTTAEESSGNNDTFKQLRVCEVAAKEQEAAARMLEAQAASAKFQSENELLKVQAKSTLLRERKKLLDEGVSQEDIDELLPIRSKK
jgi:uncharacterized ubiquitin-like protein YukD